MAYENNNQQERNNDSIFSKRLKAGKRRTYFFDVKTTRGNDYFLTITESKKRFNDNGYDRHKVFLYKEDFNKFLNALTETINYVKTELMPDFDFDAYNHDYVQEEQDEAEGAEVVSAAPVAVPVEASAPASHSTDDVDKW
ncbi:DUF3276 family protein [Chitinophaga vietnamensis]|uniref:DUF3276 family protein n=1 Tax=Chitinophaga vietnamensis TaxID=2593957 RepID=UPI0011778989|nr:DUF3276 family protein [Chitinophaga vietnamensis]